MDNIKLYIKSIGSCFIPFTCIVLVGDTFSYVANCSLDFPNTPILQKSMMGSHENHVISYIPNGFL